MPRIRHLRGDGTEIIVLATKTEWRQSGTKLPSLDDEKARFATCISSSLCAISGRCRTNSV